MLGPEPKIKVKEQDKMLFSNGGRTAIHDLLHSLGNTVTKV